MTSDVAPAHQATVDQPAVVYRVEGPVGHVVLSRPTKMNAINQSMLAGIRDAVGEAQADPAVRVLIFRGEGRAFSAGGDLEEVAGLVRDSARFDTFLDGWHETLSLVEECPLPTIAAVHGFAFAGGFELVQVCDFVVMGDATSIGDQHANFGLFPAGGSTLRLPRLVPHRVARWMLMTGEAIGPEAALAAGLVNDVAPEHEVLERAEAMAAVLSARSPNATAAIKRALALAHDRDLPGLIGDERPIALHHMASDDVQIGLAAFRARTVPDFGQPTR